MNSTSTIARPLSIHLPPAVDHFLSYLSTTIPLGSLFESIYTKLELFGLSRPQIAFVLTGLVPMVFYFSYGFVLFLLDMYSSEEFKRKYKIQAEVRNTSQDYITVLKVAIVNWLFVGLPVVYLYCFHVSPWRGSSTGPLGYPSIPIFVRDLAVSVVLEDLFFYSSHRLIHTRRFYAPIHKQHHTYTAPFGLAAIYAHPIEHLLSNVVPLALGPLLMGSHPIFMMIWALMALFNTMSVHSGYCLPFYLWPDPYFHDWHHEKFNECFGAANIMDTVFGTDRQFRAARERGEVQVPRKGNKKNE